MCRALGDDAKTSLVQAMRPALSRSAGSDVAARFNRNGEVVGEKRSLPVFLPPFFALLPFVFFGLQPFVGLRTSHLFAFSGHLPAFFIAAVHLTLHFPDFSIAGVHLVLHLPAFFIAAVHFFTFLPSFLFFFFLPVVVVLFFNG